MVSSTRYNKAACKVDTPRSETNTVLLNLASHKTQGLAESVSEAGRQESHRNQTEEVALISSKYSL